MQFLTLRYHWSGCYVTLLLAYFFTFVQAVGSIVETIESLDCRNINLSSISSDILQRVTLHTALTVVTY